MTITKKITFPDTKHIGGIRTMTGIVKSNNLQKDGKTHVLKVLVSEIFNDSKINRLIFLESTIKAKISSPMPELKKGDKAKIRGMIKTIVAYGNEITLEMDLLPEGIEKLR